jgi:protein phosphatase
LKIYTITDIGLSRTENQDRVKAEVLNEITGFTVLCDGMGGENAGSEASETAVDVIFERVTKVYRRDYDDFTTQQLLLSALNTANSVILDASVSDPEKKGMGTTCVCALLRGTKLHAVSVGDSRIYIIAADGIHQITHDHSLVMQKYESGLITKDELRTHPQRNFITKALGLPYAPEPDYFELELHDDDIVLLCSDGLSTYCEDSDIFSMCKNFKGDELLEELVKVALGNGGKDNITVALMYSENEITESDEISEKS